MSLRDSCWAIEGWLIISISISNCPNVAPGLLGLKEIKEEQGFAGPLSAVRMCPEMAAHWQQAISN